MCIPNSWPHPNPTPTHSNTPRHDTTRRDATQRHATSARGTALYLVGQKWNVFVADGQHVSFEIDARLMAFHHVQPKEKRHVFVLQYGKRALQAEFRRGKQRGRWADTQTHQSPQYSRERAEKYSHQMRLHTRAQPCVDTSKNVLPNFNWARCTLPRILEVPTPLAMPAKRLSSNRNILRWRRLGDGSPQYCECRGGMGRCTRSHD